MSELIGKLKRLEVDDLTRAVRDEYYRARGEKAVQALTSNGFRAMYVADPARAAEVILAMIPEQARVGVGGSLAVRQLGLVESLQERGTPVVHHWLPDLTVADNLRIRREELTADVFLTGTNAVTLAGELVNVDGVGNRLAAMMFGPGQVIVVAGANKVVRTVEEGLARIRDVAAPLNAIRYKARTPCATLGYCTDCDSPDRICRATLVLNRRPMLTEVTVVLVGAELGY